MKHKGFLTEKIKAYITFILCIMLALCCGCRSVLTDSTNPELSEETEATTDIQASSSNVPVSGGTLRIAMRKPETLNPLLNTDVTVDTVLKLIFEPLFVLDEELDVVPRLAESYSLSSDGKTMTIKLKSGVVWQDGNPVDSTDLIFSLDTLKTAPDTAIYKKAVQGVKGYRSIDSTTVEIYYDSPVGGCQYNMCFPIIPKQYYKNSKPAGKDSEGYISTNTDINDLKPLGNGFYRFVDYEYVRSLKLAASDSYMGRPYIENIEVTVIQDKQTELAAYKNNLIDVMSADLTQWGSISNDTNTDAAPYNTNSFEFFGFNNKREPFSKLLYRQAFAYAVPVDRIIDSIYIGNATQSLTPYSPVSLHTSSVGMDSYDYSEQTARAIISGGDFSKADLDITILVNKENSNRVESAAQAVKYLNRAGFNAKTEAVPFDEYIKRINDDDFDVMIGSIDVNENMDLSPFLSSNGIYATGKNYCNFSDGRMDKLLDDVKAASTLQKYKTAISEASKYCSNQLPLVGIGFKFDILLTKPHVKGIKKPMYDNIFSNINEWYIDNNLVMSETQIFNYN